MKKLLAVIVSISMILVMMPSMAFATTELTESEVTLEKTSITYTGNEIKPVISVVASGTNLKEGEDYTVSFKATPTNATIGTPTDVGNYLVVVNGIGDEYSGEVIKDFSIVPKDATSLSVTIKDQEVGTTPDFASDTNIIDGTYTLVCGRDYDISFDENDGKAALGTNNATLTFNGNYTGTRTVTFDGKYNLASCYSVTSKLASQTNYVYANGVKRTTDFTFTKTYASATDITTTDYTIEYSDNENYTGNNITATVKATKTGKYMGSITNIDTNMQIEKKSIKDSKISISVETSTDANIAPSVVVKDGNYVLQKGSDKDYTVDVTSANNIRITGQNNYKDSVDKTFTVGIPIDSVTLSASTFIYNGYDQKPSVTVYSGTSVVPSNGYRIEWESDIRNTGVKTVKVIGIGKYAGEAQAIYTITKKDISKLSASIAGTTYKYSGRAILPAVTVKDGIITLKENVDYKLSYLNYVSPGEATVTVTMQGNYYGIKVFKYYIGKDSISGLSVSLDKTAYDYTGYAITPKVTVKKGSILVSSSNYIVSYKNNTKIGTGTVVVTGMNDYYGTIEIPFSIVGKKISSCVITLSTTTYAADGTEKKPYPVVKYGTIVLTPDKDYTVTYANNKTAGQGSVTITGKNGYEGSQTIYFTITGLYQHIDVNQDAYTKYPTSSPFKLAPTCNGDGTGFTFTSSDSSVASVAADGTVTLKAPGKAVITIATKGDVKYTPASETVTITVKPNKGLLAKLGTPAKRSLRVYINKRAGVDGYQVRYTRGTGYKYFTAKHVTSAYKTQYRTVRYLKSGYTYKVQVRAYKILDDGTKLYGSWSTAKSLRVK